MKRLQHTVALRDRNPDTVCVCVSSHLVADPLPESACGLVPPQLQTHHGSDQVNHHGDEQEDDGGRLARLRPAERSVYAVVEDGIGAEPATRRVPDVDDTWWTTHRP